MTEEEKSKLLIEAKQQATKLAENSEKLLNEVSRLRTDIKRLLERIKQSKVHKPFDHVPVQRVRGKRDETTMQEAMYDIKQARNAIQNLEFDIRAIGNRLDKIEGSAVSRAEMASHMIDPAETGNN